MLIVETEWIVETFKMVTNTEKRDNTIKSS